MNILLIDQKAIWPSRHEYHVLTYAETGFSPLSIHTRKYNLAEEFIEEYVSSSNNNDKICTMFTECSLSIIPRRFIRKKTSTNELYSIFLDFFELNKSKIKAKKFIFDFRTHELQQYILDAIYMLESNNSLRDVEEIVIVLG